MSCVTNVILCHDDYGSGRDGDDDGEMKLSEVNAFLEKEWGVMRQLDRCRDVGGRKCLETFILVAAFNYFNVDAFAAYLGTLRWEEPDCVQLLVKHQDSERFTEVPIWP